MSNIKKSGEQVHTIYRMTDGCQEMYKISIDLLNKCNYIFMLRSDTYICKTYDPLGLEDYAYILWWSSEECLRFIESLKFNKLKYKFDDTLQSLHEKLFSDDSFNFFDYYDTLEDMDEQQLINKKILFAYYDEDDSNVPLEYDQNDSDNQINPNKQMSVIRPSDELWNHLEDVSAYIRSERELRNIFDNRYYYKSGPKCTKDIDFYYNFIRKKQIKIKSRKNRLLKKGYKILSFNDALEEIYLSCDKSIIPINSDLYKSIEFCRINPTSDYDEIYYNVYYRNHGLQTIPISFIYFGLEDTEWYVENKHSGNIDIY